MACLTPEQLSALALGIDDGVFSPHVSACPECQAKLDEFRRLSQELAAVHATLDSNHSNSRAQLLSRLSHVESPSRSVATWRRFAYGGLGLSSAAALLLVAFFATGSIELSAMERMVKAVQEVTSYSFKNLSTITYLEPDGKPKAVRRGIDHIYWRAPDEANRHWYGDLHADSKAWRRTIAEGDSAGDDDSATPTGKPTFHIAETHTTGKPGIIIFYTGGYYFWVPPIRAGEGLVDNHMAKLRAVQQGQGKIVRELGSRTIDGRKAHGYILDFEDAVPFKGEASVEVWLDPQTDLPMEMSFRWNQHLDKMIDEQRLTDIRWNIDFPPGQFAAVAPVGLIDTTPPADKAPIAEMIAALKLYAELSGGKYPRVRTTYPGTRPKKSDPPHLFDAPAVRDEMRKLTGFTDPPPAELPDDPQRKQVAAASAGLERLCHVLLNHHRAGFFGDEVGSQDKEKVLLWWAAGTEAKTGGGDQYRVFYGDLRTEIVPREKWLQLMPPEFAELTE